MFYSFKLIILVHKILCIYVLKKKKKKEKTKTNVEIRFQKINSCYIIFSNL